MSKQAKTYTRPQMMALQTFLADEAQQDLLEDVIRDIPATVVLTLYRKVFQGKYYVAGRHLLRKAPEDVQFEDVVEALPSLLKKQPNFVRSLVDFWLNRHVSVVHAMLDGTALPVDAAERVLVLAERVVNDLSSVTRARLATYAAARDQLNAAREREETLAATALTLRDELTAAHAAQAGEEARLTDARTEARATAESEFALARASAEAEHAVSLLALQKRAQAAEAQLAALTERHTQTMARRDQEDAERHAAHQRVVQELQQRIAEVRRSQRGPDMTELERLKQELSGLRNQAAARLDPQVLVERDATHARELARLREEFEGAARHRGTRTTVDLGDLLNEALIVNYPALGEDPADRLTDAVTLYRSLLARDFGNHLMTRATNAGTLPDAADRDLVVVGAELLLEDAANLGLDRILRLTAVRREAQLHQLLQRVTSPRLEGHV